MLTIMGFNSSLFGSSFSWWTSGIFTNVPLLPPHVGAEIKPKFISTFNGLIYTFEFMVLSD